MINLESRKIVAVHPHWRSDLHLSIIGNIISHALFKSIGTYYESGRVIIVEWPNMGKEEFININDVYYHISMLEVLTGKSEKLYLKSDASSDQMDLQDCTQILFEDTGNIIYNSKTYKDTSQIKSNYANLMHKLLHKEAFNTYLNSFPSKKFRNLPLVSAIIPTKNRARFLREAINSILSQSYANIEIIIVDDNSIDETKEVVADHKIKNIKYIHAVCNKSTTARNIGLAHASGKYIAYLDDDNLWFPGFIESAVSCLEINTNIEIVYGILVLDNNHQDDNLYIFEQYDEHKLKQSNYIDTNVIVHRSNIIRTDNKWDENLTRLGDWDFVLSNTSVDNTYALSVLAAYYRIHGENRNSVIYSLEENAHYIQNKHNII